MLMSLAEQNINNFKLPDGNKKKESKTMCAHLKK